MSRISFTVFIALIASLLTATANAADPAEFRIGAKVRASVLKEFDIPGVATLSRGMLTPAPEARNLRDISASLAHSHAPEKPGWWSLETREGRTVVLPVRGQKVTGILVAMDERTMTLRRGGREEDLVLPLALIRNLEVSVAHRSRASVVLTSALLSAGVGGALGLIAGDDPPEAAWPLGAKDKAVIFGALLTPVGIVAGANMDTDRWRAVEPGKVRLALVPAPKGAGLSLTIGFKGRHAR